MPYLRIRARKEWPVKPKVARANGPYEFRDRISTQVSTEASTEVSTQVSVGLGSRPAKLPSLTVARPVPHSAGE